MTPRRLIEPARLAGGAVMRTQSDERLVDLVRAGNHRAFDAIVHRYNKALLRYCRRFLTAARAEDAVQQTFMNAYRAICADDRAIDLKPWLYRIAHNAALNALRGGASLDVELSEEIDGVERPDQAAERHERLADMVAAVQALPPRQRDAIVLRELEGRSYDEIASELHVSGGAVRQLLSRARMTLRAGLTAVVPEWALIRLASSGAGEPVAARVADAVAAGGGAAVLAKAGTAMVVAGAVVTGAADRPFRVDGGAALGKAQPAQAAESTSRGGPWAANARTAVFQALPIALGAEDLVSGSDEGGRGGADDPRGPGDRNDGARGVLADDHGVPSSESEQLPGPSAGTGTDGQFDPTIVPDHGGFGASGPPDTSGLSDSFDSSGPSGSSGSGVGSESGGSSGSGGSASGPSGSSGSGSSDSSDSSGSGGSSGSGSSDTSGTHSGSNNPPTSDDALAAPVDDGTSSNSGTPLPSEPSGDSSSTSGSGSGSSGSASGDSSSPVAGDRSSPATLAPEQA